MLFAFDGIHVKSPSGPPSIHHTLFRLTYDVCFEQGKYQQQEKSNDNLSELWI